MRVCVPGEAGVAGSQAVEMTAQMCAEVKGGIPVFPLPPPPAFSTLSSSLLPFLLLFSSLLLLLLGSSRDMF